MSDSLPSTSARPANREDAAAPLHRDRERGLWNYLIWSFFLAQIVSNENFFGGPAKAGTDIDLNSPDANAAAAPSFGTLPLLNPIDGSDSGAAPPVNTVPEVESSLAALNPGEFSPSTEETAIELARLARDPEAIASSGVTVAAASASDPNAIPDPGSPPDSSPSDPGAGSAPGPDVVIDLGPVIEDVGGMLDPLLDTVGEVVSPVLGLVDDLLDTVGGPVLAIADDLLDTVGDLTAPVLALTGDLLDTVGDLAAPVLVLADDLLDTVGDVTAPVFALADGLLDTVGDVATPVVALTEDLLDTVGDVTAPVLALADNLLDPVQTTLGDVLGPVLGLVDGLLEAGQDLAGDALVPVVALADSLFEAAPVTVGEVESAPVLGLAEVLPDTLEVAADGALQIVLDTAEQILDASVSESPSPAVASGFSTMLETALTTTNHGEGGALQNLLSLGQSEPVAEVGDVVASAGSIPFNVLTSLSTIVVDDLFNAGSYTEYNLSLQASATMPALSAGDESSAGEAGSLLDHLIGDASVTGDDHHVSTGGQIGFGLPSAIDDLLFRGNDLAA